MKQLLRELCARAGVTGDEQDISRFVSRKMSTLAEVKVRYDNSVAAFIPGKNADYTVLLDAHLDRIGLTVVCIDEHGFAKIAGRGGIDSRILPGSLVRSVASPEAVGIICTVPPHLIRKNTEKTVTAPEDLYVDFGTSHKGIKPGETLILAGDFLEMCNNRAVSPALDNRAGVAVLIKLAEQLSYKALKCNTIFLLSAQEEIGSLGATTSAFEYTPDEAIIVDVSFAGQPGVEGKKYAQLGKGPMIGLAPTLSKEITCALMRTAQKANIPHQLEVMSGRTGTNSDCISVSRAGVKCGLVSIPQRYMHTGIEMVSLKDLEFAVDLLYNYLEKTIFEENVDAPFN
jgi:endoglucanase